MPSLSKLTTPWPRASYMVRSNQNAQKPWTCVSTGCMIANVKNNVESLTTRKTQLRRLLYQASPRHPPSKHSQRIHHAIHRRRNTTSWPPATSMTRSHCCLTSTKHSLLQGFDNYIPPYISIYVSRVGPKSHSFCATDDVHQLTAHKIEQQLDYEHHADVTSSVARKTSIPLNW